MSLTNFGTAFGMGLIVVTFMATLQLPGGESTASAALIGLLGALVGSVVSTRLMQRMIRPLVGEVLDDEPADAKGHKVGVSKEAAPGWLRILNSLLDGGKSGVELGMAVIPGVLIISTFVMLLTFGPGEKGYTGEAFQGVALLPVLAAKVSWLFDLLFGFQQPELVAFPATSLGAVGAAMSLVPPLLPRGGSPATRWQCLPPWGCAGAAF